MKKYFFLLLSIFATLGIHAEDAIVVAPGNVAAGKSAPCNLYLYTEEFTNYVTQIQYEVYPSEGLTVTNSSLYTGAGNSLPFHEEEDWDNFDDDGNPLIKKVYEASLTGKAQDGYYGVVISNNTKTTYTSNNGQIARIVVKAAAGLADGYYPIYVKNVAVSGADAVSHSLPNTVFYVKVGNPTDATLVLSEEIPTVVNNALAKETGISTLDLSKVTASNGTFTYVDGRKVIAPEAAVKGKVAYKREVSGLASVCLPFAADLKAYTYTEMAGEYAIFDEVSNLAANTPAIVNANIDITVADATIGSVEGKTINSGYYLKGGNLCKVNGSAKIAPLRGCWDITAPVKGFKFNDADAILTVDANANEDIFNLNGVKLNKAQRGVNIIGGKKVMK